MKNSKLKLNEKFPFRVQLGQVCVINDWYEFFQRKQNAMCYGV